MSWKLPGRPVILASQSPRRHEILSQLGVAHTVKVGPKIDEQSFLCADNMNSSLELLAIAKAESVSAGNPSAIVIGSDTIVLIDKEILGKPADRSDAARMLSMLRGRSHEVRTAVAVLQNESSFCRTAVGITDVRFRDFSDEELGEYLDTMEPFDKAGAYGIQGYGAALVDGIIGCYYNVMGLPVKETIACLSLYIDSVKRSLDV